MRLHLAHLHAHRPRMSGQSRSEPRTVPGDDTSRPPGSVEHRVATCGTHRTPSAHAWRPANAGMLPAPAAPVCVLGCVCRAFAVSGSLRRSQGSRKLCARPTAERGSGCHTAGRLPRRSAQPGVVAWRSSGHEANCDQDPSWCFPMLTQVLPRRHTPATESRFYSPVSNGYRCPQRES